MLEPAEGLFQTPALTAERGEESVEFSLHGRAWVAEKPADQRDEGPHATPADAVQIGE
ncbi:TPA: hypothetical protein QDC03_007404 [Burkholderia cepacia]|uniref:hypothetical protein n=1 Tax=Burkholderia cepacia TaxID=292 RepID=UPI0015E3DFF9|nr:hypothetical protein [Burkholderia cepacia]HDR9512146.1 hypothetical protein [Burkholderia cepacia]